MSENECSDRFQQRCKGIGGSDAAVVLGISPFKSRLQLWTEKVSKKIPESEDALIFQIGNALEPIIANKYTKTTGRKLEVRPQKTHPEYPFIMGNIDREIVGDKRGPGILEIKTKGAWINWHEDDIPPYYMAQIQHYLSIYGYDWASFAVLDLGTRKITHIDIERDNKQITNIIDEEKKFWKLVEIGVPPEVEGSKACGEFLREYYKQSEDVTIDLIGNKDATKWAMILRDIKSQIKLLDAKETECKNHLMSIVGSAEKALGNNYKISWKSPKDKQVFDLVKFKIDHPKLAKQYTKDEPQTRRFSVSFPKGETR
jgi:putative phage-type endonuclease